MKWLQKNSTEVLSSVLIFSLLFAMVSFVFISNYSAEKKKQGTVKNVKTLDGQIGRLRTQIQENPHNVALYISLSQVYLQKVRETADSSYYTKIDELMDQAQKIEPANADVPATRSSVALGRHHFLEGKKYAQEAIALDSHRNTYYGLLGDAEIELGHYTQAVAAFQKMMNLRPEYSAYVRVAYIRELKGDISGAREFLRLAISSGSSFKENIAFAYVELGKLDMRGNTSEAETDFNHALATVPEYPTALEGLGKIAFFNGDLPKAEAYFLQAYQKLSIVQFATDLSDVYTQEHKTKEAEQYITLAELAFAQSEKSGVDTDLEESLFLSDHDLQLQNALVRAQNAYTARPSIYAADYLAWALYKNGQFTKAAGYEKEALRLGENDPLILFHQGLIAAKNNQNLKASKYLTKALALNPRFSILQASVASSTLRTLSQ